MKESNDHQEPASTRDDVLVVTGLFRAGANPDPLFASTALFYVDLTRMQRCILL